MRSKRVLRLAITCITVTILVFGFFCGGLLHDKPMKMGPIDASKVVFMNDTQSCCGGTMSQHIKIATTLFLVTPNETRDILVILTLALALISALVSRLSKRNYLDRKFLPDKLYYQQQLNFCLFNPLAVALAKGVLNPKVY